MSVLGYPSTASVVPGGSIDFHLSSDVPGITNLVVERVGTTAFSDTISPNLATPATSAINAWEGFGWPVAVSFPVPSVWPSGLYRLRFGTTAVLWFVVRPAVPGATSKVLLHIPFLTYAAYNDAGGKSLYGFNSGGEANRASKVSFDRPFYNGYGPQTNGAEEKLIRWLENEGIPVECCSSDDLHSNSTLLAAYDCLVLAGHDEYWTKPMRDQTERFVANGGNMVVLSGNTCYRAVRLEQGNRQVVLLQVRGQRPEPGQRRNHGGLGRAAGESAAELASRRRVHGGCVWRHPDGVRDPVSHALDLRRCLGRRDVSFYDLRNRRGRVRG
jgi:hypothetical protein